jgi:hypothetical protein
MNKKVAILQSNYIPWKGYFDLINSVDVFVVFDDMQYTRRDWRNRNYIKTQQGLKWLTISVEVKGKYFQKINETRISEPQWNINHISQIRQNYIKAPYYKDVLPWIEHLYETATSEYLTEVNIHFLKSICNFLNIDTEFRDSREFSLSEGKTEKLVSICKDLDATVYLSGPAAKSYLEENLFEKDDMCVEWIDYSGYKEYHQLFPPFEHGVSILDLIFNEGENAKYFLKTFSSNRAI